MDPIDIENIVRRVIKEEMPAIIRQELAVILPGLAQVEKNLPPPPPIRKEAGIDGVYRMNDQELDYHRMTLPPIQFQILQNREFAYRAHENKSYAAEKHFKRKVERLEKRMAAETSVKK